MPTEVEELKERLRMTQALLMAKSTELSEMKAEHLKINIVAMDIAAIAASRNRKMHKYGVS